MGKQPSKHKTANIDLKVTSNFKEFSRKLSQRKTTIATCTSIAEDLGHITAATDDKLYQGQTHQPHNVNTTHARDQGMGRSKNAG